MPRPFRLKPPPTKVSENAVEGQVLAYLTLHGWFHERRHSGFVCWFRPPKARKTMEGTHQQQRSYPFRIGEPGMADHRYWRPKIVECTLRSGDIRKRTYVEELWVETKGTGARTKPEQAERQRLWALLAKTRGQRRIKVHSLDELKKWYAAEYPDEYAGKAA